MLTGVEETLGNNNVVNAILGEAPNFRAVLLAVEVRGLGLACKDHRHAAKMLGATQAMPMPDVSIVKILSMRLPSNRRAHSAPIWSYSDTSHWC